MTQEDRSTQVLLKCQLQTRSDATGYLTKQEMDMHGSLNQVQMLTFGKHDHVTPEVVHVLSDA